ncbi:Flagellar biosynthesis protein, FliO [Bradyrhizobium erythrophlei]|jgi:flagellar protein FliO/FliZ|nr:Flagellar biosynthesis protein, FliO [Bradyrhizobium erythrophlei]
MPQTLTFLFAFIAVLALIGVAAWLVRRFATNRLGANPNRGRMPRLAVIDAAAVDGRRRLVLVRRDNVEHLLMIGGPSDIVVEPNIVRATPGRDQMSPRPAVAGAEQPPRIAPLPDAAWADGEGSRTDMFDHAEPQMPEPPPRSTRPSFADEVRRPVPERRSDPMAGFAPEPIGSRPEPRAEARPDPVPPRMTRTEPLLPRPPRPSEPPKAPPPVRAPERAAAPPPPPSPPPAPPPQSSADQNLAEMAQRLEAALRRPAGDTAPPVAPEPPPARPARSDAPAPTPAPQKSGFENLEDEMASLLGRPKSPS